MPFKNFIDLHHSLEILNTIHLIYFTFVLYLLAYIYWIYRVLAYLFGISFVLPSFRFTSSKTTASRKGHRSSEF